MSDRFRSPLRAAPVFVSLMVACGAASAAERPGTKAPPAKPAPAKTALLSPEQLRSCLSDRDRLRAQGDGALKDRAAIDADKAEIGRSAAELGTELTTLNRESAEAVEGYNAKVVTRDKLVAGYEARVAAYNSKVEGVKAAKDAYEKACEQRRYDERDEIDLRRKK